MTVRSLFRRHARAFAKSMCTRWARRIILVGGAGVAVVLLLARMGANIPWIELPGVPVPDGTSDLVLWWVAVSYAGLWQGAVLLALVFGVALACRFLGPHLLSIRDRRTARALDGALDTDRFTAALEAQGPLAPLVEKEALDHPPPDGLLARRPPRVHEKWLRRLVIALVLAVALAPGTAPGDEGEARVTGTPGGGRDEKRLRLKLVGEEERIGPQGAVPLQLIAEAAYAPDHDLELPVTLAIDDEAPGSLGQTLFLAAGAPGQDALTFDLRPFVKGLAPGEHRAVAFAGGEKSNPYLFRIEPPSDQGGSGGRQDEKDPSQQRKPQGQQPRGGQRVKPKFVEPLVRGDKKVKKRAKVPIEVPGGGAPTELPLDQAWPELERRKEADLDRPGLSPAARKLVKEYFERLKPEEAKK